MCVDPTAGPSASDQSTWYLDESTLSDNIKKTLHKFCGPSPVVFRFTLLAPHNSSYTFLKDLGKSLFNDALFGYTGHFTH